MVCTQYRLPRSRSSSATPTPVVSVVSGSITASAPVSSTMRAISSMPGSSPRVFQVSTVRSSGCPPLSVWAVSRPREMWMPEETSANTTSSETTPSTKGRTRFQPTKHRKTIASTRAMPTTPTRIETTCATTGACSRPNACGHAATVRHAAMTRPSSQPRIAST